MDIADKIEQTHKNISESSSNLIEMCRGHQRDRLEWVRDSGRREAVCAVLCLLCTVQGVVAAAYERPGSIVVIPFAAAVFILLSLWVTQVSAKAATTAALDGMERFADYVADAQFTELQIYTCAVICLFQDRDRVLFTAADGKRYLAHEMIDELTKMTQVGRDYMKTVLAVGSYQEAEYSCVQYDLFKAFQANESEKTPAPAQGSDSLPN